MLADNPLNEEIGEDQPLTPYVRRRSSSLGLGNNKDNYLRVYNGEKNSQKYGSSGNLMDNSISAVDSDGSAYSPRLVKKRVSDNVPLENLFVDWYTDFKSIKSELSRLHENNIFKTGFPLENFNYEEFFPPVMFLIGSNLKIDCDYEIYTINNYNVRISEFMIYAQERNKDLYEEYHKGHDTINKKGMEITNTEFEQEANKKISDEKIKYNRRHSDIMGLMIVNKNQQIPTFLPNKSLTSFDVINKIGDVILTDQARKTDKSIRHVILSNDMLSIYATKKAERLKYKFFLKHLYCGTCSDNQIPNIDSSLRIGGPFGDDIILTFSNPNSRNEWNTLIQNSISTFLETFKTRTTEIMILKHLEPNSSAPLIKKIFSANGKTTGLELKKKAIEEFNQNEKAVSDYILTFNLNSSNREYILHDDVIVMVLQEHIACFADSNSCSDYCFNVGNANLLSRTHFYLKFNSSREAWKIKKPKPTPDTKVMKTKQYFLNERWANNIMPEWLMTLFSDVYYEGSQVEGIFRLAGVKTKSDELIQMVLDNYDDIEIKEEIHTKANTLKKFLSAIDGSIFTYSNKENLIALSNEITSLDDFKKNDDQINKILKIVQNLPQNNFNLLQILLVVVDHISKNEVINKMSLSNLAVCLAPTILTQMNESIFEDFMRTKLLFECIIDLTDRIVDEDTKQKIVLRLKRRRISFEFNGISTNSNEAHANNTIEMIDTNSDIKPNDLSRINEPPVPPRRKRPDNNNFPDTSTNYTKQHLDNNTNIALQYVDNPIYLEQKLNLSNTNTTFSNSEVGLDCENNNTKPMKKKRTSRERYTVAVTKEETSKMYTKSNANLKTSDSMQSPFRRQNQVNRKHRDQSMNNCKVFEEEQKSTFSFEKPPNQEKIDCPQNITKNTDHSPLNKVSRSRNRTIYNNPTEKTCNTRTKFDFNSKQELTEFNNSERKRSSSQGRVQALVQEIERRSQIDSSFSNTPTPKTDNVLRDIKIGNKMNQNNKVITKKQNYTKNKVSGPIRPTYNNISKLVNNEECNFMAKELTLKETLENSKDKDVVFI